MDIGKLNEALSALEIDALNNRHDLELKLAVYEEMKKELFSDAGIGEDIRSATLMDFAKLLNAEILVIKEHLKKLDIPTK